MKNYQSYILNCLIVFLLSFSGLQTFGQKNDTVQILNHEKKSEKEYSKFRKLYSKYLFKKRKAATTPIAEPSVNPIFIGKPIRHIHINSRDPFGYSLQDTTRRPNKWIEKTGNTLHGKTKNFVIKELLLFKNGDLLDTLKLKESERILRSQRILRRVEIVPHFINESDSVDVYINTIDTWSMVATGSISTSKAGIRIRERNFLGLGHVFDNRFRHNYKTGNNLYQFNYTVPNIAKTRIIGNVNYFKNELDHFNKSINFTRPFYSPLARIAAGFSIGQTYYQDSLAYGIPNMEYHNFKFNYTDIWGARAFRISNANNVNITNFVLSTRFYDRTYKEGPNVEADPYEMFNKQTNYFIGLGISSRRYEKLNYLFQHGNDEDVAVGKVFGLTMAMQDRPGYERFYIGGKTSVGGFLEGNYFGIDAQAGSFYRAGKSEQSIVNLQALYFSKLLRIGNWNIRQFAKANYLIGFNRWDTSADELTLHEHDLYGMDGVRAARNLKGDQKLLMEVQTQTYSPYEFLGFRISPFLNAALGVVGNKKSSFLDSDNIVARIGLGVLFTNDYFVFNNFQISFSYYPRIPGEGSDILKSNVIDNRDFNLMDFDFSKPSYIRWNRWD
ncbi:BamA/TamA family outer membrane protein [Faecalibacter bovis]|uniref:Outer membrane protein/protective antigen OMA87 n=1 Tax=Faecalibacter bovis TaxID=2898187 RepID=A0ABX7XDA6_9FLAO|nr:hypothetical protein [Faecalibacter bovis]QTV05875.1 hypothetical protein J9309_00535 [Faecalibacter bovis]